MFSIVYRKLDEIQFRKRKPFGRFHRSKMFDEFKCNGHDYLKEVGSLEDFCYVTIQITWSSKAKGSVIFIWSSLIGSLLAFNFLPCEPRRPVMFRNTEHQGRKQDQLQSRGGVTCTPEYTLRPAYLGYIDIG